MGNVYYATFALSIAVSLWAIWLAITRARTPRQAWWRPLALVCSRAFIDFSTSGLENPLSYLLLAAFVGVFLRGERHRRRRRLSDAVGRWRRCST